MGEGFNNSRSFLPVPTPLATIHQTTAVRAPQTRGDFNSSETFDWKDGPSRGNGEILGRMNALDLTECLREYHGQLTPTFKNSRGGKVVHQLDHMFVSGNLKQLLKQCILGDASKVFGDFISDHLPVIGDFYS